MRQGVQIVYIQVVEESIEQGCIDGEAFPLLGKLEQEVFACFACHAWLNLFHEEIIEQS